MAVLTAVHGAVDIKQVSTITPGGTWLSTETITITVGTRDLVITVGTPVTTADIAALIQAAWAATTRLTGATGTSNFGGSEAGEYAEVTATVSGSVVTLTGSTAGKPFTVGVAETSTSGTLTLATPQAATGKEHWNNIDNWDAGSAPASNDTVVLKNSAVGFKYNLPNATLEVTIQHYMSYTGQIGLHPVNADTPGKPYPEYRQQYVRLDDAGSGTDILHQFGIGAGQGSPLINLRHDTLKCSPVVFNTGRPTTTDGRKALNIVCPATTSELTILNGSVDAGSQFGATSGWNVIRTNTAQNQQSDIRIKDADASWALIASGGNVFIENTAGMTLTQYGGTIESIGTTTATAASCYGGTLKWTGAGTITALTVDGGDFDARSGLAAFTITNVTRRRGHFRDPYHRITFTNPMQNFGGVTDLDFGTNFSLTPVAI